MTAVPIHHDPEAATVTVAPSGDIDIATAPAITAALDRVCAGTAPAVIIDFAEVSFADSTAISVLLRARASLTAQDRTLSVINVRPAQLKMFQTIGLCELLNVSAAADRSGRAH